MALPNCDCIKGLSQAEKLDAIFCALLEISQGGGGGSITLSQITDLDPSWIPILQAPVGNFSITISQISDASTVGANLLVISTPASAVYIRVNSDGTVSPIDAAGLASDLAGGSVLNTTLAPPNSITFTNGLASSGF